MNHQHSFNKYLFGKEETHNLETRDTSDVFTIKRNRNRETTRAVKDILHVQRRDPTNQSGGIFHIKGSNIRGYSLSHNNLSSFIPFLYVRGGLVLFFALLLYLKRQRSI